MKNKYGKEIDLEALRYSAGEEKMKKLLQEFGVEWKAQYAFNETGLRRHRYDAAVFRSDGSLAFLIEYDGAPHWSPEWYEKAGTRPQRCRMHVAKQMLSDAFKAEIATKKGVPLLRMDPLQDNEMRALLLSWIWRFVENDHSKSNEINAVKMMDKYGWDFPYVPPSNPSKEEAQFINEWLNDF